VTGHLSNVAVLYDPDEPEARVTITCADCGVTEFVFPSAHLSTLVRVLADVMQVSGTTGGGMHRVGIVEDDSDAAAVEDLKRRAFADLEQRLIERATATKPKH
jgi:hypothetical protein